MRGHQASVPPTVNQSPWKQRMSNRLKISSMSSPDVHFSGTLSPDSRAYSVLFDDFQLPTAPAAEGQFLSQRTVGFTLLLDGEAGLKRLRMQIRGAGVAGDGKLDLLFVRDQSVRRWSRQVQHPSFMLPLRLSTRSNQLSFVLLLTRRWPPGAHANAGLLQIDSFDLKCSGG